MRVFVISGLAGLSLGVIFTSALIIWKALICITGSESPVVVVLSGSMEPAFKKVFCSYESLSIYHLLFDPFAIILDKCNH